MTKLNFTNLVIALIAVLLLIVGYFTFWRGKTEQPVPGLITASSTLNPIDDGNKEFLRLLNNLKRLNLSGQLFERVIFQDLRDFSVKLTPEPQGRPNPFAPLGVGGPFSTSTASRPVATTTSP